MDLIGQPRGNNVYRIEYSDNLGFQAIAKKLRIMEDEKVLLSVCV
jgi:predicted transcriptional regulator